MANTKKPVLTPDELEAWKKRINPATGEFYTQKEIAEELGVSPQWVSMVKHKTDSYSKTPRELVMDHFPWQVPSEMQGSEPDQRIRDHAEYMATGGEGMTERQLYRLANWHRHLEQANVVLEFHPDIAPSEVTNRGGFAYRPRKMEDGELIIRVNEHTNLTPAGKVYWRLPQERIRLRQG